MKKETSSKRVKVKLACVYSGYGQSWGIGEIVEVDADEAERLVNLGVASVV